MSYKTSYEAPFLYPRSEGRVPSYSWNEEEEWKGYFVDRNYIWTDRSACSALSVSDLSSRYCISSIPLHSTSCELKTSILEFTPFSIVNLAGYIQILH